MRGVPPPVSSVNGLTEADAGARLEAEGYNELPTSERPSSLRIILEVVREPMMALLLAGGLIYLAIGDAEGAIVLLGFATLSVVITIVQESRTERVLESLRDLTSPRALVIRDGERERIAGREVARADLVVLSEGDRVPADAVLIQCHDLQTDESLLTGESVPVRKVASSDPASPGTARPGGDDQPFVFSGSLVVRGSGLAQVIATGPRSQIGRIGQSLSILEREPPRLQVETRRVVQVFAVVGAVVCVLATVLYGLSRGDWLLAVLAGIALGMSMLPEEFPVVLTVFMAMGAWRISRARVLTRRPAAIETLGSATVLCTDKTGTLTENRMSIAELRLSGGEVFRADSTGEKLPEAFQEIAEYGALASAQDPFDPMDKAFHELRRRQRGYEKYEQRQEWQLVRSYGLEPGLLAMSQAWRASPGAGKFIVAAKGAPEAVGSLCHLGPREFAALTVFVDEMAAEGLRVLAVARGSFAAETLPASQHEFSFELLGLVGLADPLRASVPAAVNECRSAGVKVLMITGDYPATAKAIGKQAGIQGDEILTGEELDRLTETELNLRVKTATIFARIMPEQKLRIVNALKANGEVVAMTGDGVNDAPSLKAAHIGIAMGGRGTDVAREASSIVLLDDDFGSIVKAVRLGRRIYDNIRKAMGFIFAVHVPIAGLALLPLILGLPILFGPIHIAFLEMVIDPVCSLVFEAETEENDIMRRPPRTPTERLLSGSLIGWGLLQGACALGLVAAVVLLASSRNISEEEVRALAFFSLIMTIISLIFVNRSFSPSPFAAFNRPNPALALALLAVAVMLGLSLAWPFARMLFGFGPLHLDDLALTLGAGIVLLAILEFFKLLFARADARAHPRGELSPTG
jgi:P-type Ca2+ transporter type 2C